MDAPGAGFADSLDWQVYRQDSETTQDSVEVRRTAGGANERREREFNFDQRLYGLPLTLRKDFETRSVGHALAYGMDVSRPGYRQTRAGHVHDPSTATVRKSHMPD